MSLLLHAITTPPETAPRLAGFRGGVLGQTDVEGLTAWFSDLDEGASPFTRSDVLDAHRIVGEVFAAVAACLPARFPTLVDNLAALRKLVETRSSEWAAQIERVRDACELAVTAVWRPLEQESTPPVTATTPGRRYMLERQHALVGSDQRRARATALASALRAALSDVLLDSHAVTCPSPTVALSLALLVPRAEAEAALLRLPRAGDDVRILLNGPWPPYTFVGLGPEQGDAR